MPISAKVSSDTVVVEPGQTAPLSIEIENTGSLEDRIEVGIEGIDGEWIAMPVSEVSLRPSEKQTLKVFFNPPRTSESLAGNFPFVVRARSLEDGETRTTSGILTLKPFHSLAIELNPKRGVVSSTRRQNVFAATLMNMGNSDHSVHLFADDPEESCAYEFDDEVIALRPGQQKEVDFVVNPKTTSPLGSSRLVGFIVTARSATSPGVSSTTQGQLEIRPLLNNFTLGILVLFTVLFSIMWFTQPKPPTVRLELLSGRKVYQGSKVNVRWIAENAQAVKLVAGGEIVGENLAPEGTQEIDTRLVGTLKIQAVAFRDKRASDTASIEIEVEKAPVIPEPEILTFRASKATVRKGEQVTLEYKLNAAVTKATLGPNQIELDLNLNQINVEPPLLGQNEYILVVENSQKQVAKKTLVVQVIDPCLASIVKFEAQPTTVDVAESRTTISWNVKDASRIELSYTGGKTYSLDPSGTTEIPIVGKTVFTIKAYDVNNKVVEKSITVSIKKVEPVVDPGTGTTTGGSTDGGSNSPPGTGTTTG
jgi:hypothetical protein